MTTINTKYHPNIDYDFRPASYWAVAFTPLEIALRNVKGRKRRELIREHFAAGKLDQVPDCLLTDSLDDDTRAQQDRIHPTFMGGEYLPGYHRAEIEIARIELNSTTNDVISLRVRPSGSRIRYCLVDEYQTEFTLPQQTSTRPFSLRELIRFLDLSNQSEVTEPEWNRFGFVLSFNQSSLDCGGDLETLKDFTRVVSDFYPDLEPHYASAIDDWYQAFATELPEE